MSNPEPINEHENDPEPESLTEKPKKEEKPVEEKKEETPKPEEPKEKQSFFEAIWEKNHPEEVKKLKLQKE